MKVTAPLWEMLRNNISWRNRGGEGEKTGKDRFPAEHLNLWGGCVTILHIEIQAVSAFLEGLWQQRSKITATKAFRP